MSRKAKSLFDRFWEKVAVAANDECWEWIGSRGGNGYGYLGAGTREHGNVSAHKFSFELHNKRRVKDGLLVCHSCSNRGCVNPGHLFEGTYRDNILQAYREGRVPPDRWGKRA